MRSTVSNATRGRGTAGAASSGQTRRPLVVRQTRASAARAAAAQAQRRSSDAQEDDRWQLDEVEAWGEAAAPAMTDASIPSQVSRASGDVRRSTQQAQQQPQSQSRLSQPSSASPVLPRQQPQLSRGPARGGSTVLPKASPSTGALAPARSRPTAVAQALQKNPNTTVTAKGRAIQQDLDDLAEDYFGEAYSQAPTVTGAARFPARSRGQSSPSREALTGVDDHDNEEEADGAEHSLKAERRLPRRWREGPSDPEGRLFDSSSVNLLCMDVLLGSAPSTGMRGGRGGGGGGASVAVVGSADHGLRVFDLDSCKERKNLYTKSCGHTEWVTACRFLSDGRVLSGGMDSKLCLWDSVLRGGPARCQDLLAHTGSISQIEVDRASSTAISASYDRTLRIWSLGSGVGRDMGCLAGHKGPVTQFDWHGDTVLSGDRQGTAKIWDVPNASCLLTCATKRGQVSALGHFELDASGYTLSMLGDQGGVLTVLDPRQGKKPVHQAEQHPGGALTGIQDTANYLVTCGADKRLCVLDPRMNFDTVYAWTDHRDFIYSVKTFGPLVLSGAGNGWLLVHDTTTGACLYGLGANTAAVREMYPTDRYLVAAGDDGKAVVYDYA